MTTDLLKEKVKRKSRFDVVFSCVDSWKARKMLNDYCRLTATPLFNGGVSTFGGVVDYFIPGKMHCLECSNDYRKRIEDEEKPASCGEIAANVVMPNAVIGSMISLNTLSPFSMNAASSTNTVCADSPLA